MATTIPINLPLNYPNIPTFNKSPTHSIHNNGNNINSPMPMNLQISKHPSDKKISFHTSNNKIMVHNNKSPNHVTKQQINFKSINSN